MNGSLFLDGKSTTESAFGTGSNLWQQDSTESAQK